jgi:hypothetical protein
MERASQVHSTKFSRVTKQLYAKFPDVLLV